MHYALIFLYLILGHLIGDMLLQTRKMVKTKGKAFDGILLHSIVVTIATAMIFWVATPKFWMVYIIIFIGHTIIDEIKCKLDEKNTSLPLLIIDQIVHFLFLALVVVAIGKDEVSTNICYSQPYFSWLAELWCIHLAIILSGAILAIQFGHNLVQKAMLKYDDIKECKSETKSICGSEALIGKLERTMVYIFAITGNISSIAFILIAKAIYDFGRTNKSNDNISAGNVIIRTFISFCWAIAIGLLTSHLIRKY